MQRHLSLGSVPYEVTPAQLGSAECDADMLREAKVFKRMLERLFPADPGTQVSYRIQRNQHEFGIYLDVILVFDDSDPAAVVFACHVEKNPPPQWDAIASYELAWFVTHEAYRRAVAEKRISKDEVPRQYLRDAPALNVSPDATFSQILAAHPF